MRFAQRSTATISFLNPRSVLLMLRISCSIWKRLTRVASARKIELRQVQANAGMWSRAKRELLYRIARHIKPARI
jgi:hypothetical protein